MRNKGKSDSYDLAQRQPHRETVFIMESVKWLCRRLEEWKRNEGTDWGVYLLRLFCHLNTTFVLSQKQRLSIGRVDVDIWSQVRTWGHLVVSCYRSRVAGLIIPLFCFFFLILSLIIVPLLFFVFFFNPESKDWSRKERGGEVAQRRVTLRLQWKPGSNEAVWL